MFATPNILMISATFSFTNFNVIVVFSLLLDEDSEELDLVLFFGRLVVAIFNSEEDDGSRLFELFQNSRFDFNHEMKVSSAFCK